MSRKIACRSARGLLVAVALAVAALAILSQPGPAFASFSGADRQEQPVASEPAASEPAAVAAAPARPSAAAATRQRRMAAKQRAMHAAAARQQAEGSRRAARRAFVGGLIIGVLAARRR